MLNVYDTAGRLVSVLVDSAQPLGPYSVGWDGTDALGHRVAAGRYFLRLRVGEEEVTRRVVAVR